MASWRLIIIVFQMVYFPFSFLNIPCNFLQEIGPELTTPLLLESSIHDAKLVNWTVNKIWNKFKFRSSHFSFLVFGHFWKVTKIQKYCVIFVYILQGKMDETEETGKKITQLKWPKYQKPKDKNMGWMKHKFMICQYCNNKAGNSKREPNLIVV